MHRGVHHRPDTQLTASSDDVESAVPMLWSSAEAYTGASSGEVPCTAKTLEEDSSSAGVG